MSGESDKSAWKRPYVAPRVARQERRKVEGKFTTFTVGENVVYGPS